MGMSGDFETAVHGATYAGWIGDFCDRVPT
jgi:uncharacterized pyridoxal phosphate-containing UPF0001 family protein